MKKEPLNYKLSLHFKYKIMDKINLKYPFLTAL